MAVAFSAASSVSSTAASSVLLWTHNEPNSSAVALATLHTVNNPVSPTATYAGSSMTLIEDSGGSSGVRIFRINNPSTGAQTISMTFGTAQRRAGTAVSFTGANLAATFSTAFAAGLSSSPSVTIASAAGDMVVDFLSQNTPSSVASMVAGSSQTERARALFGATSEHPALTSTEPGQTSVTMSWSGGGSASWRLAAINIAAAAAVSSRGPQLIWMD